MKYLFIVFLPSMLLQGCSKYDSCSDGSETVQKALKINQEDLHSILEDSKLLLGSGTDIDFNLNDLPQSIKRLEPLRVVDQAGMLWIYLDACSLDSKVIMIVQVGVPSGEKIVLQYSDPLSEQYGSVLLWGGA